jgi:hypothetical protein
MHIKLKDLLCEQPKISEQRKNEFLAKFGMGPLYKPTPPKKHTCPKCKKGNATYHEAHADTDMNCMELRCPDCGHVEEE